MTKDIVWMVFILFFAMVCQNFYNKEQINKGKSISHYLAEYQNIDIPPSEARWLRIEVTQYDLDFHDVDVFMPNLK